MESHYSDHNSNLSPSQLVYKLIDEITFLADMLSPNQQRIIKDFCNQILQNRSAVSDATNLLPLEAALFVIQVTEREKINKESTEVYEYFYKRIKDLEGEIENLKKLLNEET